MGGRPSLRLLRLGGIRLMKFKTRGKKLEPGRGGTQTHDENATGKKGNTKRH